MKLHHRIIPLLLIAIAAPLMGAPLPRAICPEENFRFNNQLMPLTAEMDQGTWKEGAGRLGDLMEEAVDELKTEGDGGLISFGTWARKQPWYAKPELAEACNELRDERARQMLDVARLGATHRPADLAAVAYRFPLTTTARVALVAAADRALELGDAVTAAVLYDKATAAGWKADELHAKRIEALAPVKAARRVGRLPMEAKWYMDRSKWPEPKVLPLLAGNRIFVETGGGLNVLGEAGNSLWNWTAPKPVEGAADPAPVELITRGLMSMPAVLVGLDGSPEIVVSRLPQSQSMELCLRAFRARDGRPLWTTDGDETFATALFVGQPLVAGAYVYCVVADDGPSGVQLMLLSLDVMTGSLQWRRPLAAITDSVLPRTKIEAKPGVLPAAPKRGPAVARGIREADDLWAQSAPGIDEDCVYVAPNIGCVIAVGRLDGKIRWTRRYPSLTCPDDRFPVKPVGPMDAGAIRRWEGESRLRVKSRFSNSPGVTSKAVVVAPYDFGGVLGLDKSDGRVLWESRDFELGTLVGSTDKTILFSGQQVSALDGETGQQRWRQDPLKTQKITGPASLIGGFLYAPTAVGPVAWSVEDGRVTTVAPKLPDAAKLRW